MNYDVAPGMQQRKQYSIYGSKIFPSTDNGVSAYYTIEVIIHKILVYPGFLQALEIMENLENHEKKFHAWKNHGI